MNSLRARSPAYSPLLSQCLALHLAHRQHSIYNFFSLKENIIRFINISLEFRRQADAQVASREGGKREHGKGGPHNKGQKLRVAMGSAEYVRKAWKSEERESHTSWSTDVKR